MNGACNESPGGNATTAEILWCNECEGDRQFAVARYPSHVVTTVEFVTWVCIFSRSLPYI
jgi:hypothetical protein